MESSNRLTISGTLKQVRVRRLTINAIFAKTPLFIELHVISARLCYSRL